MTALNCLLYFVRPKGGQVIIICSENVHEPQFNGTSSCLSFNLLVLKSSKFTNVYIFNCLMVVNTAVIYKKCKDKEAAVTKVFKSCLLTNIQS